MSYTAKVHKSGSDTLVLESGAILDVKSGAVVKVNAIPVPAAVTFSFASAASTVSECTISVKDGAGVAVTTPQIITFHLSDAATGLAVTGTAADTLAAKAASGSILSVAVAGKADTIQTLANGTYVAEITSAAKTLYYIAAYLPSTGLTYVSRVMVAGDYGA